MNSDSYFDGVEIVGTTSGQLTTANNVINGNNVGSTSAWYIPRDTIVVCWGKGNKVTGWATGILSGAPDSTIEIHSNCIFGNSCGINNYGSASIDATLNYWGHDSGPYHATLNLDGQGNSVSSDVEFIPWYTDEDCSIPSGELEKTMLAEAIVKTLR